MSSAAIVVGLAILAALLLVKFFPDQSRRWFERIRTARTLVFVLFSLAVAAVFIASGSPLLMFVGGLMLTYGFLWFFLDGDTEAITRRVPYL